jgi:hypothetical protein
VCSSDLHYCPEEHCAMRTCYRCYLVPEVHCCQVPYVTCHWTCESRCQMVTCCRTRYVCEDQCCQVPYTTCHMIPEVCRRLVPCTECRMEPYCEMFKVCKRVPVCVPMCIPSCPTQGVPTPAPAIPAAPMTSWKMQFNERLALLYSRFD